MEIIIHNKRFMARLERQEPAARDSTATVSAKKCFRYYFYKIVLGRVSRIVPPYFKFGECNHEFFEKIETTKGDFNTSSQAANKLWKRDPPVGDKYEFLTQDRMLATCIALFKFWEKEKSQGKIELICPPEQPLEAVMSDGKTRRGGRADQIVRWNGKPWGRDLKCSTKPVSFFQRALDPNDQMTGYTWLESQFLEEFVQGQIIIHVLNTKKEGPVINQILTTRTDWQIKMWEREQILFERQLQLCRDEDLWPMCEGYHCSFCEYHSVCKASTEAGQMAKLETEFDVRYWDFKKLQIDPLLES